MRALLLLLCLLLPVQAQSWTIFINNRPFNGEKSGGPDKLLLEANTLAASTDVGLKVEGGAVTLKGEPFPSVVQGANILVDVRELAARTGGKYTVNKEMQSVDIYLIGKRPSATADSGSSAVTVKCFDLVQTPDKYAGKTVTVRGELMVNQNISDASIQAGWASGYIRQMIEQPNGTKSYYNVDIVTGSRIKEKTGKSVVVTGVFANPDNRPTIKVRSMTP